MIHLSIDDRLDEIKADPTVQEKAHAAMQLEMLQEHVGWQYLRKRFERYPELVADGIAKRFLRGEDPDPKELNFARGYAAAIADFISMPERVVEELELAAEKAYRRLQEQEETSTEEPPYT